MPNPVRDANDRPSSWMWMMVGTALGLAMALACTSNTQEGNTRQEPQTPQPPPPSTSAGGSLHDLGASPHNAKAQPDRTAFAAGPAVRVAVRMGAAQMTTVAAMATDEAPVPLALGPWEEGATLDGLLQALNGKAQGEHRKGSPNALQADHRSPSDSRTGRPTVVQVELLWVPELAASGLIEPVSKEADLMAHTGPLRNLVARHGELWAHPDRMWCQMVWAHRPMLDAVGLTRVPSDWDGLLRAARLLTVDRQGRHSLHPGFDRNDVVRHGLFMRSDLESTLGLFEAMGAGTVDAQTGEPQLHGPSGVEAARWIQGLRGRHGVTPPWLDAPVAVAEVMEIALAGRVAMWVGSSAGLEDRSAVRGIEVWPLPVGRNGRGGCPAAGLGYVVVSGGGRAAHQAARWLASAPVQDRLAHRHRVVPTLEAVRRSVAAHPRTDGWMKAALDASSAGRTRSVFPGLARLAKSFDPALMAIARGQQEPTATLDRVAADWRVLFMEMSPPGAYP